MKDTGGKATMSKDVAPAPGGNRTVYLAVGVWYDEDTDSIHITLPSGQDRFHTTVNNKPGSKRRHENLYGHLKRILVEHGRWPADGN